MGSKKIQFLDIAKGIGIILIILGYIDIDASFFRSFIYQFHVPLFFVISGFLFTATKDWCKLSCNKINRLYIPFVIANSIFLAADVLLRHICGIDIIAIDDVKHLIKVFLGIAITPMGGATWFIIVLFRVFFIVNLFCLATKGNKLALLSIAAVLLLTMELFPTDYFIRSTIIATVFFIIGILSKPVCCALDKLSTSKNVAVTVISLALLLLSADRGNFSIFEGYDNRWLMFGSALIGTLFVLRLSTLISRLKWLGTGLSYVGERTMWHTIFSPCCGLPLCIDYLFAKKQDKKITII